MWGGALGSEAYVSEFFNEAVEGAGESDSSSLLQAVYYAIEPASFLLGVRSWDPRSSDPLSPCPV